MLGCCRFLHILASLSNFWKSETNNEEREGNIMYEEDSGLSPGGGHNISFGKIEVLDLK